MGHSNVSVGRSPVPLFVVSNFCVDVKSKLISSTFRLVIGLFGLLGMFGVAMGPIVGRVIDRFIPWYTLLFGTLMLLVFQIVQTIGGGINISAVIISCFGLDVFRQMQMVSLSTAAFRYVKYKSRTLLYHIESIIYSISASARSRINAILTLSVRPFLGE